LVGEGNRDYDYYPPEGQVYNFPEDGLSSMFQEGGSMRSILLMSQRRENENAIVVAGRGGIAAFFLLIVRRFAIQNPTKSIKRFEMKR